MDNREETAEIKRPKAATGSPSLESSMPAEDETSTVAMAATAVEVKGLSYTFPDGTVAIQDVSFTVAEKEKVAIIGPNGAGKSTLLLLLNGLLRGQGLVKIAGLEVCRRNVKAIRLKTGLVFQDPDDQLLCRRSWMMWLSGFACAAWAEMDRAIRWSKKSETG